MKQIVVIGIVSALIQSCSTAGKTSSTIPSESADTSSVGTSWKYVELNAWKLIQFQGKMVTENNPVIQFDRAQGRVFGFNGCNRSFGTFRSETDKITVNMGSSTMMACSPEAMELEQEFMQSMTGKTYSYDIADQTLNMYENGTLVLMFGKTDKDQ